MVVDTKKAKTQLHLVTTNSEEMAKFVRDSQINRQAAQNRKKDVGEFLREEGYL